MWSGDVDLNDGKVQEMYGVYARRLSFIATLGKERTGRPELLADMAKLERDLIGDLSFVASG